MTENEFLAGLRRSLSGLSEEDIRKSEEYCREIISDAVEDGMNENDMGCRFVQHRHDRERSARSVAAIGSPSDAAKQILMEAPLTKVLAAKVKPQRRLRTWEILLLVLGAPIWLSLLLTAAVLFFGIYIVLWSVVVAVYATVLALVLSSPICFVSGIVSLFMGRFVECLILLAVAFVAAGAAILLFVGAGYVAKGVAFIGKKLIRGLKTLIIKRS